MIKTRTDTPFLVRGALARRPRSEVNPCILSLIPALMNTLKDTSLHLRKSLFPSPCAAKFKSRGNPHHIFENFSSLFLRMSSADSPASAADRT